MTEKKPFTTYVLIFVVLALVNTALAHFGGVPNPVGLGYPLVYVAVAFMIVFGLWFGGWGALAAYLGCFVGSGVLGGLPLTFNLYWSLADLWQVLIPLAVFRALDESLELRTKRAIAMFVLFGVVLNNIVGAAWGAGMLAIGGLMLWSDAPALFTSWLINNLVVCTVLAPLLLRYATPYIRTRGLLVEGYWR